MKYPFFLTLIICLGLNHHASAFDYPVYTKTLANGLKIIVCEKPTTGLTQVQLWYRTGSKDETDGIRGMAHMFEHMMFRGSKNYSGDGDVFIDSIAAFGVKCNASTSFDCTVYYESIANSKLKKVLDMEADRMNNLVLDQKTLDIERQVVGEELRNGENDQFRKMSQEVYEKLYPDGHPYRVDVIGDLPQILNFTTQQCQQFYNPYSPNNAVLVIVGDVKKDEVFKQAEESFGSITKQVHPAPKQNIPDIFADSLRQYQFTIDLPLQVYGYMIPAPSATDPDYYAFVLLKDLLFGNENSILYQKLVNEMKLAYSITAVGGEWGIYTNYLQVYVAMDAQPGNLKVKKVIAQEIQSVIDDGIDEEKVKDYLSNLKASETLGSYHNDDIATELGMAEICFNDYTRYDLLKEFEKITPAQLQQVAKKYFAPENFKIVNIKPAD